MTRRRVHGVVVTVLAAMLVTTSCGTGTSKTVSDPLPVAPSPPTVATVATSAATTPDLEGLLLRPSGYQPVPGDGMSGPVRTAEDVHRLFSDTPGMPAEILGHGFVAGYVQNWTRSTDPTATASTVSTVEMTAVVLQFRSIAQATTMVRSFRRQAATLGYTEFAVPANLTAGYGVQQRQGSGDVTTSYYAVAWAHGPLVYEVSLQHSGPPTGEPHDVIAMADRQDSRAVR